MAGRDLALTAGELAACIFLVLWSSSCMLSRLVLPLLIVVLLSGCGKPPETSPSTPVSTTEPVQGGKTDVAPATEQAAEVALNAALMELTQALRKYSFENQRLPKTVDEVVAAGYLKTMPQAPPGKRFAIDAKTVQIVLVNQ